MGPTAGLDRCGISRPTGIRSPDRPARSQSLYRVLPTVECLSEIVNADNEEAMAHWGGGLLRHGKNLCCVGRCSPLPSTVTYERMSAEKQNRYLHAASRRYSLFIAANCVDICNDSCTGYANTPKTQGGRFYACIPG